MKYILMIVAALALGGCDKTLKNPFSGKPTAPAATSGEWTIAYSHGMPPQMVKKDGKYTFEFPKNGSIHYVYTKSPSLSLGKEVILSFEIEGQGVLKPVGEGDEPPATISLYIQRKGDDVYKPGLGFGRWWSAAPITLTPGTTGYIWIARLDPQHWINIWGKNGKDHPAEFKDAIRNAEHIGFTFSGKVFRGHGLRLAEGNIRFILREFEVR
jgi:hypothetical protein